MSVDGEVIENLKESLLEQTGDIKIFTKTVCLMKSCSKMKMSIMQVIKFKGTGMKINNPLSYLLVTLYVRKYINNYKARRSGHDEKI